MQCFVVDKLDSSMHTEFVFCSSLNFAALNLNSHYAITYLEACRRPFAVDCPCTSWVGALVLRS